MIIFVGKRSNEEPATSFMSLYYLFFNIYTFWYFLFITYLHNIIVLQKIYRN